MHCETWKVYVTALVRYVRLHGTSPFCLHCFECCSSLNKNLFLQSQTVVFDFELSLNGCATSECLLPFLFDVHILCHAKQTRSLVPLHQVKAIWRSGLLLLWWENWQPLNCVFSLNLHTCSVANCNHVFSLFSYCICYLVASVGIFFGEGGLWVVRVIFF